MRLAIPLLVAVLLVCGSAAPLWAFQSSFTDQFGESVYTISGPDQATVGQSVEIVLSARDALYPNDWIASSWTFKEDGVQRDSGFSLWTSAGVWERRYSFLYTASGSHTYAFRGRDQGHGGGGMNWAWFEVQGVTIIVAPPPVGACCQPDGSCAVEIETDCASPGIWHAEWTSCTPNPCAPSGAGESPIPAFTALRGAIPNPCHGSAAIGLDLAHEGYVNLDVYDSSGRLVRHLYGGTAGPCRKSISWDAMCDAGRPVSPGVYYLRMTTRDGNYTQPVSVIR
jgi:hypothetical protein